jgi:hypothetical protein
MVVVGNCMYVRLMIVDLSDLLTQPQKFVG